jgi:molecular chaperone DnaJ
VDNGARLRIQGEGEADFITVLRGSLRGDLCGKHPFFQRQGNNFYCQVPIGIAQAVLGAEITVPTLEGEEKLKVPEGTQSGSVFRLRNKGIVSLGERGRGDQFVTVNIVVPTKLSKEQRKIFEELAKVSKDDELTQERNIFDKVKDIFG